MLSYESDHLSTKLWSRISGRIFSTSTWDLLDPQWLVIYLMCPMHEEFFLPGEVSFLGSWGMGWLAGKVDEQPVWELYGDGLCPSSQSNYWSSAFKTSKGYKLYIEYKETPHDFNFSTHPYQQAGDSLRRPGRRIHWCHPRNISLFPKNHRIWGNPLLCLCSHCKQSHMYMHNNRCVHTIECLNSSPLVDRRAYDIIILVLIPPR